MNLIIVLLLVLLIFGGGLGYHTYGVNGGMGAAGTIIVVFLILWLLGVLG